MSILTNGSFKILGGPVLTKLGDLLVSVKILSDAKRSGERRIPEHLRQSFDLVGNESCFIAEIQGLQLHVDHGIVDEHS